MGRARGPSIGASGSRRRAGRRGRLPAWAREEDAAGSASRDQRGVVAVGFASIVRFALQLGVVTALVGGPLAFLTYRASSQAPARFVSETTLIAPIRPPDLDLVSEGPVFTPPLMPEAYRALLEDSRLLGMAWSKLTGAPASEAPHAALTALSDGLTLRWVASRRSMMLVLSAEGPSRPEAIARANAVAEAMVDWDDAYARTRSQQVTRSLEGQLATLQRQLEDLEAAGSRANAPQIAAVSLFSLQVNEAVALARAQAVAARGNLEFLQPAARATQLAPSPLVDTVIVVVLTAMLAAVVLLVRGGLDRRVRVAAGLADVAGTPLIVDLRRARAFGRGRGPAGAALSLLKAQLDLHVPPGGRVVVAAAGEGGEAEPLAKDLARLYRMEGSQRPVEVEAVTVRSGEALEAAAGADAVIMVAEPNRADRAELRSTAEWLRRVGANLVGIVAAPRSREARARA